MEIRIVIFLALVSIAVSINTLLILFACRKFAGMTTKVTRSLSRFQTSNETRQWLASLQIAAARAATFTEGTKVSLAELDDVLSRRQESYRHTLESVDKRLEKLATNIDTASQTMRDAAAKPAFAVGSFAAGLANMLNDE